MRLIALSMLAFVIYALGSSYSEAGKTDIEIVNVEVMNWKDLQKYFSIYVEPGEIQGKFGRRLFLVVTIKTRKNYLEDKEKYFARNYFANAYFCDFPNRVAILSFPSVYYKFRNISWMIPRFYPDFQIEKTGDLFEYQIILGSAWHRHDLIYGYPRRGKSQEYYYKYDLEVNASDICVYVSGNGMFIPPRKSNVAVLLSDIISSKLKEYRRRE